MEDFGRKSYPYLYQYKHCSSSNSPPTECFPRYHGNTHTIEGIQIRTPTKSIKLGDPRIDIDDDAPAAVIFDPLSTKLPDDYGLLTTAFLQPVVQLDQTAEDDPSPALTQCSEKFLAKIGNPAEAITCKTQKNPLLNSSNPLLPTTRSHRCTEVAAGEEGDDREAGRESIGIDHVRKVVERKRRNKMKALCSTLISLLPEEYHKVRLSLSRNKSIKR